MAIAGIHVTSVTIAGTTVAIGTAIMAIAIGTIINAVAVTTTITIGKLAWQGPGILTSCERPRRKFRPLCYTRKKIFRFCIQNNNSQNTSNTVAP